MGYITKNFSTFSISYVDVKITEDNFHKYGYDVEGKCGYVGIHTNELTYELSLQLRSDDENQVRDALDTIIRYRMFWANMLSSMLQQEV